MSADDRELAARIVDQVERAIRRDGVKDPAEARRRLGQACPWSVWRQDGRSGGDPRFEMYQREAERAQARLFGPSAPATAVEVSAPLAAGGDLSEWLNRHRVALKRPESRRPAAEAETGPQTLDMFEGGPA
jgi:hypothetical protein